MNFPAAPSATDPRWPLVAEVDITAALQAGPSDLAYDIEIRRAGPSLRLHLTIPPGCEVALGISP